MPNITSVGNVLPNTPGFEFLQYDSRGTALAFSGSTLPTLLQVGFLNDVGVFVPFEDGTITTLPSTLVVDIAVRNGIVLNVSGGSPNFNLSEVGPSGDKT